MLLDLFAKLKSWIIGVAVLTICLGDNHVKSAFIPYFDDAL
jgi:hypothetical protein